MATQVALAGAVVADLAGVAHSIWSSRVLRSWYDDPASADASLGETIDNVGLALILLQVGLLLVAGVLMIIWLYRAHASDRMNAAWLQHGSGWAIGGWFVPILNLWRPYQMVRDVERGATSGRSSSAVVGLWWAGWLGTRGAVPGRRRHGPGSGSRLPGGPASPGRRLHGRRCGPGPGRGRRRPRDRDGAHRHPAGPRRARTLTSTPQTGVLPSSSW